MARVGVRVLNAQNVSEPRPQDEVEAGIVGPSERGDVDVWLLSEVAWADLHTIAKRHGLYALQYGARGSADAGVGILSRQPITAPALRLGSRAVPGVRMRPLLTGHTFGGDFTAGHAPPRRTPVARALYIARARTIGGAVGGDWNRPARWMRLTSRRKYRGVGVLGLLVPRRWDASVARTVRVGSDHLAVDVELWIP